MALLHKHRWSPWVEIVINNPLFHIPEATNQQERYCLRPGCTKKEIHSDPRKVRNE